MATRASHKNLSGAFSPAPGRGAKLAGLLGPAAHAAATAPEAQPEHEEAQVQPVTVEPQPAAVPDAPAVAAAVPVASPAPAAITTPVRSRQTHIPRLKGARVPAASVYLSQEAYKRLQATKSKKIKGYAEIVQDAFAHIAKEAADRGETPDSVLAELFSKPTVDDDWLMPSSPTRAKSATPLTEARISFSAQQRDWIEAKMNAANVSTLSEFIARVLEYYLMPAKSGK
ncbi:hypothetical protein B5P44_00100 [Mycobacterium sp. CBMA 213]|uniref:Uncharacterized protein n=1 Tax=Mycolicibacterium sp. CBMA 213 TaxID=1968788 RepID=A0A343VQZ4_9MYCO|nr:MULTISPECIES: hypothetical protein [unclassified Mycolicibacterium]AVN58318.1 hypothetical protein B5P44_p00023 [Mycolicibacterium sp. CBMA 213]MUL60986.1 hypothetical protein [Mycolicibacterium sp. CBMA 335]MUM03223.1 hypothetical protein [Mycolicibacterium sp. CBMA 213]